jgi:hypothetical protein
MIFIRRIAGEKGKPLEGVDEKVLILHIFVRDYEKEP